jgi:large subunit ribosomal protein L18
MAQTTEQTLRRQKKRSRRQRRVRNTVRGSQARPRLSVHRSNRGISAQVIDDLAGITLVSASSLEVKEAGLKKSDVAQKVGEILAAKAKEKNIDKVVFDRGSYLYHGRVKALADGARKGGIDF